jgi:hypothetical protein
MVNTVITTIICEKCKIRDAVVFHDCGNMCLSCWAEHTYPDIDMTH